MYLSFQYNNLWICSEMIVVQAIIFVFDITLQGTSLEGQISTSCQCSRRRHSSCADLTQYGSPPFEERLHCLGSYPLCCLVTVMIFILVWNKNTSNIQTQIKLVNHWIVIWSKSIFQERLHFLGYYPYAAW